MLDIHKLKTIFAIHSLSSDATHDEIRKVLAAAHYTEEEISEALIIAKRELVAVSSRRDGLYKIFRTDEHLAPSEVSALLGVDLSVDEIQMRNHRKRELTGLQSVTILTAGIILAVGGLMYVMYMSQIGPFHPTVSAFSR
jgi:hypothetical protein